MKVRRSYFGNMASVFRDIYDDRVILSAMIKRTAAGRYKSSVLGFAWNMVAPVLTIIIMYVVFTAIRKNPIEDYWIYLCAGMFPVSFMSGCLRGRAIVNNATFITKMKFPREIVVIADTVIQLLSVIMVYLVVVIIILSYGDSMNWAGGLMIPVMIFLMFVFGLGCSFLLSTVCVFVPDLGNFMGIVMRLIVWATPACFLASEATGLLATLVWSNPFTYFVEAFQDLFYYTGDVDPTQFLICCILAFGTFFVGWGVFEHYKNRLPEVLRWEMWSSQSFCVSRKTECYVRNGRTV